MIAEKNELKLKLKTFSILKYHYLSTSGLAKAASNLWEIGTPL